MTFVFAIAIVVAIAGLVFGLEANHRRAGRAPHAPAGADTDFELDQVLHDLSLAHH